MGAIGRNRYEYLYETEWIIEGAPWQSPEPITLRDEAGVVISSSQMATMLMTIYNVATDTVIPGADGVDVKNLRGCSLSTQGIFLLKLLSADTVMLDPTRVYERRRVLIRYTWPTSPTKADALELTMVVRNLHRVP
jgi:hypothetical protein